MSIKIESVTETCKLIWDVTRKTEAKESVNEALTLMRSLLQKEEAREYQVKPGDTLTGIAVKEYGDSNKWALIHLANPGLDNPHKIKEGDTLRIPTLGAIERTKKAVIKALVATSREKEVLGLGKDRFMTICLEDLLQKDKPIIKIYSCRIRNNAKWPEVRLYSTCTEK